MQMFSMNRRLTDSNVTVTSLHPGVVETGLLATKLNWMRWLGWTKSAFEGSWTTINAAVNPDLSGVRDVYFRDSQPSMVSASSQSKNEEDQEKLWEYTLTCLKDYLTEDVIKCLGGDKS